MKGKPKSIDAYLRGVPREQRAALQRLREQTQAAAPRAEECIHYQLPGFRLDGKPIAAFGAFATTIPFQPDAPLPAKLVRKLVRARVAALSPASRPRPRGPRRARR